MQRVHRARPRALPTTAVTVALAAALAASTTLTACSGPSDDTTGAATSGHRSGDDDADRVIEVSMVDNRFVPDTITVAAGEQVTLRFHNDGAAVHEAFIGEEAAQDAHGADMADAARHGDDDDDDDEHGDEHGDDMTTMSTMVVVEPGDTGELVYTAPDATTVVIGCHQPGHWASGMRATITVT
jgi:uncharacterized cupredoxin-like copper-binding protein